MGKPRLTKRLLVAMEEAVTAMLAGIEGQGDWPEGLPRDDLDDAADWIDAQLAKRALSGGSDAKAD